MSRADFSLFIVSFAAALVLFFGLAQEPWENIGLLLIFIALLGFMDAHLKGGARAEGELCRSGFRHWFCVGAICDAGAATRHRHTAI